jgi:hypothetical protein
MSTSITTPDVVGLSTAIDRASIPRWLSNLITELEPRLPWVDEFTNPATADTDAIVTSVASANTEQTYSGAGLDGVVGAGTMSPPRNITFTTSSHADIDAVACVITGLDIDGNALTETVTLTDGGGVTDAGVKAFASVSSIVIPAQSGSGGTVEIGFGVLIGLTVKAKARGGTIGIIQEIEAGSVVATGTFAAPATGAPYGTYSANNAPDGAKDYVLYYERDTA